MTEQFLSIALDRIQRSNYNPRTHFDDAKLKELADSIKEKGVLEPILVRSVDRVPIEGGEYDETSAQPFYEIVAGERRYRAAKLAGLSEIPVIVRDLSDQEAAEIAIVENAQRADLTPVEEARGFKTLIEQFGYTTEDAAVKMGLSPKTVAQRIRLLRLPGKALDAIESGKLSLGSADYLARMDNDKLREEATKKALDNRYQGEGMTPRDTLHMIRHQFMTDLSKAPFPTTDKTLIPEAGACNTCPHQSGSKGNLFGEIKEKNLCQNIACFGKKKEIYNDRLLQEAKSQNLKILSKEETKKIFPYAGYSGAQISHDAKFVDANEKFTFDHAAKKRTYRQLVGSNVEPVVAVDGAGQVRHLYPKALVQKELKTAGFTSATVSAKPEKSASEIKRERQAKADAAAMLEALKLARASAACMVPKFATTGQSGIWKTIAQGYLGGVWDDTLKTFIKVFEIEPIKGQYGSGNAEAVRKWLAGASDTDSYIACLVISLIRLSGYDSDGSKKQALNAAFDVLGIDFAALQDEQLQLLEAKAKPASTKPGKATKAAKSKTANA